MHHTSHPTLPCSINLWAANQTASVLSHSKDLQRQLMESTRLAFSFTPRPTQIAPWRSPVNVGSEPVGPSPSHPSDICQSSPSHIAFQQLHAKSQLVASCVLWSNSNLCPSYCRHTRPSHVAFKQPSPKSNCLIYSTLRTRKHLISHIFIPMNFSIHKYCLSSHTEMSYIMSLHTLLHPWAYHLTSFTYHCSAYVLLFNLCFTPTVSLSPPLRIAKYPCTSSFHGLGALPRVVALLSIPLHHFMHDITRLSSTPFHVTATHPPLQTNSVRATAGRATRTSGRARTSRGSEGLVYYEIIDYIINAPSRGSVEERMGIPCWWRYI